MARFQLTIEFSAADTRAVNEAGEQVALAKELAVNSGQPVIWISFSPFESNLVQWRDEYGLFASPDRVSPRGTIQPASRQLPAKPETIYPFERGTFGRSEGSKPRGEYATLNRDSKTLTFGLVQTVSGGGEERVGSPINAVVVSTQMEATFVPTETVFVFLQKKTETGIVDIVARSEALKVPFSTANPDQTVHYDGAEGRFIPGPLN